MAKPGTPSTYRANYLAGRLRAASIGREQARFAELVGGRGRTVSYGEMFDAAERIAAVLVAAGVEPGDRVAAQVEKSLEAVQLYLGTVLAGGVFLPLNPDYTATEMAYFLGDSAPSVFVCDPSKMESLGAVAGKAGVSVQFSLAADGTGTLSEAAAGESGGLGEVGGFDAIARGKDDLAALLYTSGTTGRAKGAMLSHGNLASNAAALRDCWRFADADVLIHALPLFHTHGLFVAINTVLVAGASLRFMPKFDADAIVAAMARATVLMGVPTFYVRLLNHPGLDRDAAAGMRLFISGSAPLLAETHHAWRNVTGHAILERYGLSETGMNLSNPYHGERRAGTVGLPLPGVEVRLTDMTNTADMADPTGGAELPRGEVGMIEVRGPNVFRGYWHIPEKTREALRENGFFITGDLGVMDARGYVTLVGRTTDVIISGGYNVYPKEIETLINGIEGVTESAVIGLPHPDFGEGVAAVVVVDAAANLKADDVLAGLKDKLAGFKQPKFIFFTEKLPRNAMGKVQKNILRELYDGAF